MSQGGQAAWLLLALIAGACGSSSPPPAPAAESAKSTATHDIDRASMDTSVAPGDDFYRGTADKAACRQLISDTMRSLTGRTYKLVYEFREDDDAPGEAVAVASPEEIFERFKSEFEAEEIVPDDNEEPSA